MRVALHSQIRAGSVSDYLAYHARVPDELVELFARAGIADWTIWRSGDRLFHLVECDDFDAAMAVVDGDPANRRWQADIGPFVELFRDTDGRDGFAALSTVWSMKHQRRATRP